MFTSSKPKSNTYPKISDNKHERSNLTRSPHTARKIYKDPKQVHVQNYLSFKSDTRRYIMNHSDNKMPESVCGIGSISYHSRHSYLKETIYKPPHHLQDRRNIGELEGKEEKYMKKEEVKELQVPQQEVSLSIIAMEGTKWTYNKRSVYLAIVVMIPRES